MTPYIRVDYTTEETILRGTEVILELWNGTPNTKVHWVSQTEDIDWTTSTTDGSGYTLAFYKVDKPEGTYKIYAWDEVAGVATNVVTIKVTESVPIVPMISNVSVTLVSAGNIQIKWNQNIPGLIKITRNGVQVFTWNETSTGLKEWVNMNNTSGTYIFCVNSICAPPFYLDCISNVWYCELPLNGWERDGCINRRINSKCNPPTLKWKCSGSPNYTCSQTTDGTYNTQTECISSCKTSPSTATHALQFSLSPLSWANYTGLLNYLPSITTAFAEAITLYGWIGWTVVETRIEGNNLVIYLRETATAGHMSTLAWPTVAAISAAAVFIIGIALRFGYLIIAYKLIELATGIVKVEQTKSESEQLRIKTITDLCNEGKLTPEQCNELLEKSKPGTGLCGLLGLDDQVCTDLKYIGIGIGALIVGYTIYKILPKNK